MNKKTKIFLLFGAILLVIVIIGTIVKSGGLLQGKIGYIPSKVISSSKYAPTPNYSPKISIILAKDSPKSDVTDTKNQNYWTHAATFDICNNNKNPLFISGIESYLYSPDFDQNKIDYGSKSIVTVPFSDIEVDVVGNVEGDAIGVDMESKNYFSDGSSAYFSFVDQYSGTENLISTKFTKDKNIIKLLSLIKENKTPFGYSEPALKGNECKKFEFIFKPSALMDYYSLLSNKNKKKELVLGIGKVYVREGKVSVLADDGDFWNTNPVLGNTIWWY